MTGTKPLGAVLAGGRSRRMGRPKALVELRGRPLIAYPLEAVRGAGLEALIVAKPGSELPDLDCEVLREPADPVHPLAGLLSVLGAAGGRRVVALACDMPFVPPALLSWLAESADAAAVIETGGRLQPLLAAYDPAVAAQLAPALAAETPLGEAVRTLDPRIVDERELRRFGDPKRIAFNVNSPADLERAERWL